ncbi:MAG: DUF2269 family protein [Pseudomonas sp.]|nr:MAG: DUF2269 family protein [Pseudomonas sp.]
MTVFSALYAIHVLAALFWVGGMFFAWMILRPAAVANLQAPERLTLWLDVLRRFFLWVWIAVLVLPVSGMGMLHMRFSGFDTAPRYVQVMMGLYLVMLALFLRVRVLQMPLLRQAVETQNWSAGGDALGRIRRLVGSNLLVGTALVAIAAARPGF